MARKAGKVLSIVLGSVLGFVAVVILALQILLNSKVATNIVDKAVAENIDADLSYSGLRFSLLKDFPKLRVTVDSLSLTYPHDRYSGWDRSPVRNALLAEGRGETADTLARFDRFTAAVNVWRIFGWKLRLSDASIDGLGLFAHQYDSTAANWNIFPSSEKVEEEDSSSVSLPWISVGEIAVRNPRVVYTAQSDTVFASAVFDSFRLGGDVRIGRVLKLKKVGVSLDSLRLSGRLPADTLALNLDSFSVRQTGDLFDIGLLADALMMSDALGVLRVPVSVSSRVSFSQDEEATDIGLRRLDADIAHIPLTAEGSARILRDSTLVDLRAGIEKCSLQTLLREYLDGIVESSKDISTDARMSLDVRAKGALASGRIPAVDAALDIPACSLSYAPLDLAGSMRLALAASATPGMRVDADLSALNIDVPGLVLDLVGGASDLAGKNPSFRARGFADADLGRISGYLPKDAGISADGRVDLRLDGRATMSQIKDYTADLEAKLTSDTLSVNIGDELAVAVRSFNASLDNSTASIAGSGFHPLEGRIDLGSVRLRTDSLSVAARQMKNTLRISKDEYRGRTVPRLSVENATSGIFFRSGTARAAVRDVALAAALKRRAKPSSQQRRAFLDSLQRVYPGVPRDSLFSRMRKERAAGKDVPVYLTEKDWKSRDISVALDTSITRYLREWSPSGSVSVGKGIVAVPQLPLRNRLNGLEASFTDNDVSLSRLDLESGTSDVSATGKVSGLRRFLMRDGLLKANLDVSSSRINATEILAALKAGRTIKVDASQETDESAYMESFVVDSLSSEEVTADSLGLFVVPANIDAAFNLNVGKVDWTGLDIRSLKASATMKERCAQVTDVSLDSDAGKISLDAFYSTQTKKDISAGFDLDLSEISADRIISLVPSVDEMMPALKSFKGNLNCQLTATTQLDTMMNIVMPSLDGVLKISGKDLRVEDAGDLRKITRLLMFKDKNIGDIEDLDVSAFVHDNKVEVFPFIIGVDRYRLALCGMQGFDSRMNYHVSILKTPLPIRFGLNLYGTFDNWKFSIGRAKYRDGKVPAFTQQIDTMQVNIAKSIRQIYRRGVKAALQQNSNSFDNVEKYKKSIGYLTPSGEDEFLTTAEYCQIDSLQFELEIAEMEEQIMAEVEDILDETFVSAEALSKEFDKMFFDKRLIRQQERSARRDARKAEREAKKSA